MTRAILAAIAVFCTTGALAAEPIRIVELEPELAPETATFSDRVDFAWGLALTSNYILDGVTQSHDNPAFQAWGEISSGIAYAGIWTSTVELDPDNWEFDLSWGVRPTLGALDFDVNYTRYFYDETGDDSGEWIAGADYKLSDSITASGELTFDPQSEGRSATAGLTLVCLEDFELSGEVHDDLVTRDTDWNAGLTWQATNAWSLDLRYYGSEFAGPRFVMTLTYEGATAQ